MFFSKSRNSKIIVASLVLATLLGFAQIGLYNNSQLTANAGGPDYSTTLTFCQGNTSKQILTLKSSAGNQINVVSSKLPQNFFYGSEILGLQNTSTVVTFYPSYSLVQNLGYVKDYSNIIVQQSNRSGNIGKKLYIEIIFNIINCNYSNNSSSSSRINSTSSFSQNYYSSVIPTSSVVYNSSKAASSVLTSSSKTNSSSSLVNSSYVVPVSSAIFTSSKAASSMVYNSSRANSSAVSSQNYFSSAIPVSSQTNIYRSSSSSISSLAKYTLGSNIGYVSGEPGQQLPSFYLPGSNVPNGTAAKFTPYNSTSITGQIYYSTFYADYGQVVPSNVTQGNSYATVSVLDNISATPVRVSTYFNKSEAAKVVAQAPLTDSAKPGTAHENAKG